MFGNFRPYLNSVAFMTLSTFRPCFSPKPLAPGSLVDRVRMLQHIERQLLLFVELATVGLGELNNHGQLVFAHRVRQQVSFVYHAVQRIDDNGVLMTRHVQNIVKHVLKLRTLFPSLGSVIRRFVRPHGSAKEVQSDLSTVHGCKSTPEDKANIAQGLDFLLQNIIFALQNITFALQGIYFFKQFFVTSFQ